MKTLRLGKNKLTKVTEPTDLPDIRACSHSFKIYHLPDLAPVILQIPNVT